MRIGILERGCFTTESTEIRRGCSFAAAFVPPERRDYGPQAGNQ